MELKEYLDYLVEFIKETVKKANAKGVVIGISGGIDSAVVACLAKKAFPNDYTAVWMPIESSDEDYKCKQELIDQCGIKAIDVELKETFLSFKKAIKDSTTPEHKLAIANAKARLRMTTLYTVAQTNSYLVLGTDNLDEWHIGYFTKFGDGGVDMVPLVHLLKREVREAARILGVPTSIINRAPTASLWEDQTDESELGITYDQIDAYLAGEINDENVKSRVDHLHKISEHKRNGAVAPKEFKRK
ncbi:NH3-dependent NAD+ synthetase [Mesoplasma florum L1]|uniref:NH(3)-dependent NAD(+) synthetase n=2 Tax=Mesoplasma florum TaxID=2151 RepID=NADE_MESFL|nr:NAD(+) synthase [Mesoplasma florum]Q6F0U4.1 RecName: Full=NH(3)-dependent NAD(+) synthetase [Mesoplasma florum L1]AAT75879.1 NH3-dependent NAD+ synthetase [Mesoplasma florum L1]AGY41617.1 NAD synthetase [Mesoplasma florum W37]ATI73486.1 NAD(+) synthetase [Mesoplasma florum]ATI74171.1 NAD(+) synthetase [Mesoplasma florum]AVN59132.1 NAD(+) synthetase [Mesoplasma florum]